MCGDWNTDQSHDADTTNQVRENHPRAREAIAELREALNIHDVWRMQHPLEKRFTWRNTRLKESRLDYFLISDELLVHVVDNDIYVLLIDPIILAFCYLYRHPQSLEGRVFGSSTLTYCMMLHMLLLLRTPQHRQ